MPIQLAGIQKITLYPVMSAALHKELIAEFTFPASYRKDRETLSTAICTVQYLLGLFSPPGINMEWGKSGDQYQAGFYLAVIHETDKEKPVVIETSNKDWKEGQIVKLFAIIWILAQYWKWEIQEQGRI